MPVTPPSAEALPDGAIVSPDRPLVRWVLAWLVGLLLGFRFAFSLAIVPLAGFGLWAAWRLLHRPPARTALLCLALLFGWWRARLAVRPNAFDENAPRSGEYVQCAGRIASDPVPRFDDEGAVTAWRFRVNAESIRRETEARDWSGRVNVVWRDPPADRPPAYGQRVILEGPLYREPLPGLGGRLGLERLRLEAADGGVKVLEGPGGSLVVRACLRQRREGLRLLALGTEHAPEARAVLEALLLGARERLDQDVRRTFAESGTLHIFAISGAHVAIMAMMLTGLVRFCGVPARWRPVLLIVLLLGYVLMVGAPISAVRAWVMTSCFWLARMADRRPDARNALALAAFLLLLFDPGQIVAPGFLLSFAAVWGLIELAPLPIRWMSSSSAQETVPALGWRRRARRGVFDLTAFFAATAAAWLATAPLSARFFNLFTPVALAANLVVIPAAFVVMALGACALTLGRLLPVVAEGLNALNVVVVEGLLCVVRFFAEWPGGHAFVRAPPVGVVAAWYLLLAAVVHGGRRSMRLALVLLSAAAFIWWGWARGSADYGVTAVDVGESLAILLEHPRGDAVLIDTGGRRAVGRTLRALRARGVDRLRALVLTHGEVQQIGAAEDVLERLQVDELWLPAPRRWNRSLMRVERLAEERKIRVRRRARGMRGRIGEAIEWEILAPASGIEVLKADDACLVTRWVIGGLSILVMSDAGRNVERDILDAPIDPSASLLVVGRHGDDAASGGAWLDAVAPEWALISVGRENREGHPSGRVLQRLRARGVRVLRTDESGTIRLHRPSSGAAITVSAEASP